MVENTMDHKDLEEGDGLLFACILDGAGGARFVGWEGVAQWSESEGALWLHLDNKHSGAAQWLEKSSGLTLPTSGALLAEETRPRVFRGKRGVAAIMRGVNMNNDALEADMVTMRFWSDGKKVITLRHERMHAARDILEQLIDLGSGPKTAPELFERLIARVNVPIAPLILALDEQLGDLENELDISKAASVREKLSDIRQKAVSLRRNMAPQREALSTLLNEPPNWLDDTLRAHMRETSDRLIRYLEELDATRERAMVVKDDIANQLSESTNRTLYVLTIMSAILMPLGFLTGLLGINIGGMPGVDSGYAFWVFCMLLVVFFFVELAILRRLRWL